MEPPSGFQTVFLSRESSHHPLIPEVITLGHLLQKNGSVTGPGTGTISIRYGKRLVITTDASDPGSLTRDDFVEVVDYNPITRDTLVIGLQEPSRDTPLHWLLYKNDEIHTILQLHTPIPGIPQVELTSLDQPWGLPLEILKLMKTRNPLYIPRYGCLAVGGSLQETHRLLC